MTVSLLSCSVSESDKEEKPQSTVIPKEVTPALCSLMSSYGSLSGSESEPEGKLWLQLLQAVCFVLVLFEFGVYCASVASFHVCVSEGKMCQVYSLFNLHFFHLIQK